MEAAARGAAGAGGEVIGILPGTDPAEANEHCTHVVATGTGHARNLAVVASADAVIAIAGEWGTLSEIAFARAPRPTGGDAGELGGQWRGRDAAGARDRGGRQPRRGGGGGA